MDKRIKVLYGISEINMFLSFLAGGLAVGLVFPYHKLIAVLLLVNGLYWYGLAITLANQYNVLPFYYFLGRPSIIIAKMKQHRKIRKENT